MHKIHLEQSPTCIIYLFKCNLNIHTHNTIYKHHIHLPRGQHECVYETFVYKGIHIWNILLDNLDVKLPVHIFKRKLKEYLLTKVVVLRYSR